MSLVVDEHREYLSDGVRLEAFRAAIRQAVRPGDVVLDLASGTGILGLMACEAGASRVYSVEATGMIEIARQVAAANGVSDRITFIHGYSTQVALPERVDVLVCDQIGHFGFEAGLIEDGGDARERFLKPDGRFVPACVDLCVAPIDDAALRAQVEFWTTQPAGFEFASVRGWALHTGYPATCGVESLLGEARVVAGLETRTMTPAPIACRTTLTVDRAGTLHGLAGWFSATLAGGVTLTNAPTAAARLRRRNVFFPIDRPVAVQRHDTVDVALHIIPTESVVNWSVDVRRADAVIARSRHSTLHGMLLTRDDLRRTDPRFVPTLTPRGQARLSVLALCDGRRALADIEREMLVRHADIFDSLPAAATFVSEVVAGYAKR